MFDQKWTDCDGKEAITIHWPDTDDEKGRHVTMTPVQQIICRAEYMGDRTEVWFAVVRDGVETVRHNGRMVESVVWK